MTPPANCSRTMAMQQAAWQSACLPIQRRVRISITGSGREHGGRKERGFEPPVSIDQTQWLEQPFAERPSHCRGKKHCNRRSGCPGAPEKTTRGSICATGGPQVPPSRPSFPTRRGRALPNPEDQRRLHRLTDRWHRGLPAAHNKGRARPQDQAPACRNRQQRR